MKKILLIISAAFVLNSCSNYEQHSEIEDESVKETLTPDKIEADATSVEEELDQADVLEKNIKDTEKEIDDLLKEI